MNWKALEQLVQWGRLELGRQYFASTGSGAQLFAGHRLVTQGPYAWVRHPIYLGDMLAGLGGVLIYRPRIFCNKRFIIKIS